MHSSKFSSLPILFLLTVFLVSCNNNSEPNEDALFLEFSVEELSNTVFSVDNERELVEVTNHETIGEADPSALTASFSVSSGATVYVGDEEQTSGETVNDFSEGVFYTVVSEDELSQKTYFVYLDESLPLNYLVAEAVDTQLNPSGRNPLAAELNFETRESAGVSVEVLGDYPIQRSFDHDANSHQIPVIGLYADTDNRVVLTVTSSEDQDLSVADTLTITTDPLPEFLPTPEINVLNENQMEPGMHFNEFSIGNAGSYNTYPLIFDNNGDIRWYIDLSEAGKIAWGVKFNNDGTFYYSLNNAIIELDLAGNEVNRIVYDNVYVAHHEVRKIANGNYIIAVNKNTARMIKNGEERPSVEDFIIEVNASGDIVTEWDMAEVLDVNRTDLTDGGNDWFHMNAIWHDEDDNALIVSGRNQGIVKVNWDNELQWIMAPHQGWGKAGRFEKTTETDPFLLTAVDNNGDPLPDDVQQGTQEDLNFSWTWGQHTPMYLPNGNLFVFDNGFHRNFGNASDYSMGTEYKIDEENMTVEQVWSYGKDRGGNFFSRIISDVDLLPETENRLIMPGIVYGSSSTYSKITEVDPASKEIIFESTLHFENMKTDGGGWGNADITYRGGRISLDQATASEKR